MAKPSNPNEIARETFKQLVSRRIAPTPENYQQVYCEIAEIAPATGDELERELVSALQTAASTYPALSANIKTVLQRIEAHDWTALAGQFNTIFVPQTSGQGEWADTIRELLRQWEIKQRGLTSQRKKDALERVLINFGKRPDELMEKLRGLSKAWAQGSGDAAGIEVEGSALQEAPPTPEDRVGAPIAAAANKDAIPGILSEILAQALVNGVMPRIAHFPELVERASLLADALRESQDVESINQFSKDIRQFWIELELRADADHVVLDGLTGLLRLLIDNITELLADDQWLRGQLAIVQDIMSSPLSPRVIGDAEQHLKEVIFKQGTIKHSLNEAKATLKNLVTVFIEQIGELSNHTGEYHKKIESYAGALSSTEDLPTISSIVQELISDTRSMHIDMVRSHEEMLNARKQAEQAETRIRALEDELGEVSELIYQDHLTGALNRRGMEEAFTREFARAERGQSPLSIAMLDVDHFKKLNDAYGHETGDQALVHLITVVKEILRPSDIVARYGGEEFVVILPDTDRDASVKIMTRLQRELTKRFFMQGNEKILITFSAGVAQRHGEETADAMIMRADAALYRAKQTGRNRVLPADSPSI